MATPAYAAIMTAKSRTPRQRPTGRVTVNIRSVPVSTKQRLDFLSKGRSIFYGEYLDRVTRLHAAVEREARRRGGGVYLALLTEADLPLGPLEPPP
jgi:hypothetical protein